MEKWNWRLFINEDSIDGFYFKLAEYFINDYKDSMFGANIDYLDKETIEEIAESIKQSLIKSMNKVEISNCEKGL